MTIFLANVYDRFVSLASHECFEMSLSLVSYY